METPGLLRFWVCNGRWDGYQYTILDSRNYLSKDNGKEVGWAEDGRAFATYWEAWAFSLKEAAKQKVKDNVTGRS